MIFILPGFPGYGFLNFHIKSGGEAFDGIMLSTLSLDNNIQSVNNRYLGE